MKRGFSIVELMVSIGIASVLVLALTIITFNFYADIVRENTEAQLALEGQLLQRNVSEQLRIATDIHDTNVIADVNEPGGGWSTSDSTNTLIIAIPTVDSNNEFIIDPLTNEPYQTEIILYQQGNSLRRRTLVDPLATTARAKTSCPDVLASASCPADGTLSANFSDFIVQYFDQDNVATTTPSLTRFISLQISLSKRVSGKIASFNQTAMMTLRN